MERRREAEQQRLLDQLPRTRSAVRRVLAQVLLLLARLIDERPIIANVSFVGLKEFDTEALSKSLKDVGIGEGKPFWKAA